VVQEFKRRWYFRNGSGILNAIREIGVTESIAAQDDVPAMDLAPGEKVRRR